MPAPRTSRPAAALCLLTALLATAAPAGADGTPAKRPIALLVPPGQEGLGDSLVVAAGSGLLDLDAELFVLDVDAPPGPPPEGAAIAGRLAVGAGAFAAIWVDPAAGGTVFALAAGDPPGAAIARGAGETDPGAQVEAMAVIIRTAVEQLLAAA
jgi:hypothetical protein